MKKTLSAHDCYINQARLAARSVPTYDSYGLSLAIPDCLLDTPTYLYIRK